MTEETQTSKESSEQTETASETTEKKDEKANSREDTSKTSDSSESKFQKSSISEKPLGVLDKSSDKDNIIFVGIKPFMNYVTGVVMQFQNKGQKEVIVSARGKFISKAVDIVEVARRTFLKEENIKIDNISISSEQFENKEGKRIFVSAIEIRLVKE